MTPIKISDEQADNHVIENEKFYFERGSFNCLNDHSHFRPGCLHLLLGKSGKGKSTFARSVLADVVLHSKVLYLSTEETQNEFEKMLSYNRGLLKKVNASENLHFIHESEIKKAGIKAPRDYWVYIYKKLKEWNIKLLIFDNLTTSIYYDSKEHSEQVMFFDYLKKSSKTSGVAYYILAHTASQINDKVLFTTESIRGSRGVTNRVEFAQAFQDVSATSISGTQIVENFIRTIKARSSPSSNKTYLLDYDPKTRMYVGDKEIPFHKFKEIFKLRDSLS